MSRKYAVEIDMAELTLRLIEAGTGARRPTDKTPQQLLNNMPPPERGVFVEMAAVSRDYFLECLSKASEVN